MLSPKEEKACYGFLFLEKVCFAWKQGDQMSCEKFAQIVARPIFGKNQHKTFTV
jgi:hypothetical protein